VGGGRTERSRWRGRLAKQKGGAAGIRSEEKLGRHKKKNLGKRKYGKTFFSPLEKGSKETQNHAAPKKGPQREEGGKAGG